MREIDLVRERATTGDPVFKHPMVPSYEGFVPRLRGKFGNRYSVSATEGLADFERQQQINKLEARKLRNRGALQDTSSGGRSLGERSVSNLY